MFKNKRSTCSVCGHTWVTGNTGTHSCTDKLLEVIAEKEAELKMFYKMSNEPVVNQLEEARQGFADAKLMCEKNGDKVGLLAFTAYHKYFDSIIVTYGRESVL